MISAPRHQPVSTHSAARSSSLSTETQIITGPEEILGYRDVLVDLSRQYEQFGAMDFLEYFLSFKMSRRKTPHLILMSENSGNSSSLERTLRGALLVYEYRVLGIHTGIFATDDTSGRRTLIGPEDARMAFGLIAAETLMRRGARAVVLSFVDGAVWDRAGKPLSPLSKKAPWFLASRRRLIRSYLPLEATMDATLAKIGQKTRSNLRYYRRRAEAQLGCNFVEHVEIERSEFLALNRECAFAVADDVAGWRYDWIRKFPGFFLYGIRDRDGRWLSLLGGRRYHDSVEVDWQMNRADLPAYSLSAVMRAYLIEHEIARGTRKMLIEGGTPHAIRFSFTTHPVRDLIVTKRSLLLQMVRNHSALLLRFANRFLPKSNFTIQMLTDEKLQWQDWR